MITIRIHGRGGHGVVSAAEILAIAAFMEKKKAQAFPDFGVERSGAPIQSFVRINDEAIITREQIIKPDYLLILDSSLLKEKNTLVGVSKNTLIIINAEEGDKLLKKFIKEYKRISYIPASEIAFEIFRKNLINTTILGYFIKKTKILKLESLLQAIQVKFKDKGKKIVVLNQKAITKAYNHP